ncbi:MAG: CoA transferase [Gammaproteobacteria bacterium]|jgi:crotonobetainyl-CoA:carnitine CoA-transferase CaiB-like acyl-CoA transferase
MDERIFEGLKVLDVASFIAGPVAATIMADFGAEVIKVEAPGGDPYRSYDRGAGMPRVDHDYSWLADNRSKRGICLDLKQADGQAILRKLVAGADVFITNFPLPVRATLGLNYEDLAPLNERLIYASLTAYGEEGPESVKSGFDSTALWARSGLMHLVRTSPDAAPARSVPGMGDHPTGTALFAAIAMALYRRERTGKGGHVSTSLVANGAWWNTVYLQAALTGAAIPDRPHRDNWFNALANHYRCRDGRWFILSLINEEKHAGNFFAAIGRPELLDDPRFRDRESRRANAAALIGILDDVIAQKDWADWHALLEEHGITSSPINRAEDVPSDPVFGDAGAIVPVGYDGAPVDRVVSSPVFVRGQDKRPPQPAPVVGEHNADVLRELGFDDAEIARLQEAGVVRTEPR